MASRVRRVSPLGDDRQEAVNLCARILPDLHLLQRLTVQPHGFKERGWARLSPRSSIIYLPAASVQIVVIHGVGRHGDVIRIFKCQWVFAGFIA